ncbi:hypothetical protein ACFQY5_12085 [Paeniroseomonas aquatica]|uniref:hypothetical protein n=1 Tax=Paeniroseomonas aquatica TaxID=373043 RepID=UPI00360BF591
MPPPPGGLPGWIVAPPSPPRPLPCCGVPEPGGGAPTPDEPEPMLLPGLALPCGGWVVVPMPVLGVLPGLPTPGEPGWSRTRRRCRCRRPAPG